MDPTDPDWDPDPQHCLLVSNRILSVVDLERFGSGTSQAGRIRIRNNFPGYLTLTQYFLQFLFLKILRFFFSCIPIYRYFFSSYICNFLVVSSVGWGTMFTFYRTNNAGLLLRRVYILDNKTVNLVSKQFFLISNHDMG
jgi:hypothetical protein